MPASEAEGDLEDDEERDVRRLRDRACLVGAAGRPWISGRVEGGAKGGGAATDPSGEEVASSESSTGFAASCEHARWVNFSPPKDCWNSSAKTTHVSLDSLDRTSKSSFPAVAESGAHDPVAPARVRICLPRVDVEERVLIEEGRSREISVQRVQRWREVSRRSGRNGSGCESRRGVVALLDGVDR